MSKVLNISIAVLLLTTPAWADWDPQPLDDPTNHKMHYPQLPDPNGWDVDVTVGFVADDWKCSSTGPVDDIHFWISAEGDNWGNGIDFIDVTIYDDVPAGTDPDPTVTWSHPGEEKWTSRVQDQPPAAGGDGDVFTIREPALQGVQGWYAPYEPYYTLSDHVNYWQVNIQNILNPFEQELGTTYWLEIHIIPNALTAEQVGQGMLNPFFGWKTSLDHWNDDAVYEDIDYNWQELYDPRPGFVEQSLDMAFVITPEPATLIVLALGLIPVLLKRRRV